MAEKVNLIKQIYGKDAFSNTIDISFESQSSEEANESLQLLSVEEFFDQYNQLFYQIPKEGPLSHTTLIQQSQEYVGDQQTNDEIDALIQEINGLRETVLEQQETIFNLTIRGSLGE